MKQKTYMALMMAAVISLAGCGKKTTTTTEVQTTPKPTEAPVATEEPEQEETSAEEVTAQTDDTGVYYGRNTV